MSETMKRGVQVVTKARVLSPELHLLVGDHPTAYIPVAIGHVARATRCPAGKVWVRWALGPSAGHVKLVAIDDLAVSS